MFFINLIFFLREKKGIYKFKFWFKNNVIYCLIYGFWIDFGKKVVY